MNLSCKLLQIITYYFLNVTHKLITTHKYYDINEYEKGKLLIYFILIIYL